MASNTKGKHMGSIVMHPLGIAAQGTKLMLMGTWEKHGVKWSLALKQWGAL